ncbi:MAG: AAA family ATPase, partial [Candidatus Thorarchaeota archaeon]
MPEITLSPDQATAYDAIQDWLNNPDRPYLTMGGYAGTGKTTIIKHLCEVKDDFSIHVCALTGKAALNAGAKLQHMSNITVSTIHSFLYRPLTDDEGNLIGWELRSYNEWEKPSLIVVDEASMVTEKIFIDLLALDIPILFVGDHGQLPPITKNEDRVDDERVQAHRNAAGVFNLMFGPELRLEQIHRQALDSPIIRMSMMARQGTWIKHGDYGEGVCKTDTVAKYEHLL